MTGRLTLLLTSPRVAPGLLTRSAWLALGEADHVIGYADEPVVLAVREAGIGVTEADADGMPRLGRSLVDLAQGGGVDVVWLGSSDGDPGLTDVVAAEVTRRSDPPEVEVLLGSHDVLGSRLLDLVAVMDRLRSPGGCPWDAEQTHETLVTYLIEEAYEAVEALESGDRRHMVEELGDVLLQVAFHARVGEEDPDQPFDIDDVAASIVEKLVRRHPHVFGDATQPSTSAAEVESTWESIKAAERAERAQTPSPGDTDLLHGIPTALPTLARADKVVGRIRRAGQRNPALAGLLAPDAADLGNTPGQQLLRLVIELEAAGVDTDAAMRGALRDLTLRVEPTSAATEVHQLASEPHGETV